MADNNIVDGETERQFNDYQEFMESFIDGFQTQMFNDDVVQEIDMKQLQKYFANPDDNNNILTDLAEYFYITSGEIHMMFELIESLPILNYRINAFQQPDNHEKYINTINKNMHKVKHKTLTRDILKQTAAAGTVTGIWLGNKNNIHPYIFDDPTKVFPAYRKNGDWVVYFDLQSLDGYSDFYKKTIFDNLSPYVTEDMYDKYKQSLDKEKQHIALPQERTFVIQTHKLRRNQGLGTGWANSAMFDVLHKRKMKNVERTIANKIINSIAVLTIGNKEDPQNYGNIKLNKNLKHKVFNGVRNALDASSQDGVPVVALPEFADLQFPDIKTDGLDGKKFDHINSDIQSSIGISSAATNGEGGNHANSKINLDIFYKRIAVLLEQIDTEMYQKMINIILPNPQSDNYYLSYDKTQPLSTKEKVDVLVKLNDKGWSVKELVDQLPDTSWEEFLDQTLYETEELNLQERIIPYNSTHTTNGDEQSGANEKEDLTEEGESTRTNDKNDTD